MPPDLLWFQSLAKFLLTSSDPISFFLGLGVQIILSGQTISSSMYLKPQSIAQALHGIITSNVRSDEQTMLFVTACTAKEILYLDLPETEEIQILRRFFNEIIAIDTFPLRPTNELRDYTRFRSQMFDHYSSMRLAFSAPINIWLVLHDTEALVQVSPDKILSRNDAAIMLQDILVSIGSFLQLLMRDLWVESPEALEYVTEGFKLCGQMVMVCQGLEMAVNIGRRSAFYDSFSVLRESLIGSKTLILLD
ncbi:hypothetical protein BDV36DRAFT_306165 [Aspergillus pseudocaelatus]|uniref:Transcription factor domain-containing protein n=1 Tax=Aspergillus pseudocaelatus TaxID=1825620 RepID=A0ABQ6X2Y0_9EURO|nr:hypothetical protein BDV36DRAFT_306165 [Aspergillus pseudocaelatus]